MVTTTFTVTGMTCEHCVGAVKEEVGQISGVTDVAVDLASGQVTIVSERDVDVEDVRAMVDEAGYALAS